MTDVNQLITDHLDIWTSATEKKSGAGRGSGGTVNFYGIQKLRELILELAVRGRLVPQDASEGTAVELLKKVELTRQELLSQKLIRKQKKPGSVKPDEMRFTLPKGWAWTRLIDLAEISPKNDLEDDELASFVPMPEIGTSHTGEHGQEERRWGEIRKSYTHFADGDVALAKITPCFENSKAAVFSGLRNGVGAGTTELHVARLFCKEVAGRFILLHLKAPSFLENGKPIMTGSAGQKRVPRWYFSETPIALPPTAEQHRIVAKVDELMRLCGALQSQAENGVKAHQSLVEVCLAVLRNSKTPRELADNWSRLGANFDTLFKTEESVRSLERTILELAIRGLLVSQDQNEEPASEWLDRSIRTRTKLVREKAIRKPKAVKDIDQLAKPYELPANWTWARLPEIGELARGKSKHRPRNDRRLFDGGTYPLVQTGDVARADPFISEAESFYNDFGLEQSRLWPKGTLCITIAANIADTGILSMEACFPDSVVGYIPFEEGVNVSYFDYFIRTAKNDLEDYAPSTAQKNINLEILGEVLVPLPPKEELNRICLRVSELLKICENLRRSFRASQDTKIAFADALTSQIH